MTFEEFEEIGMEIRYKPGHALVVEKVSDRVAKVWWEFHRPNCYKPDEWGVGRSGPVLIDLQGVSEEGVVRQIFGMTMRLEEHECREWFLYGHERPFDPHVKLI